jgi:hypothetical protein
MKHQHYFTDYEEEILRIALIAHKAGLAQLHYPSYEQKQGIKDCDRLLEKIKNIPAKPLDCVVIKFAPKKKAK